MACVASLLTSSEHSALSLVTSAWRYEGWLHAYPLNRATVVDYFKHSPFYSLQANNERINAAAASSASSASVSLRHMEGLEYVLDAPYVDVMSDAAATNGATATNHTAAASASYFVIRKQWRLTPSTAHLLAVYYVVAASVDVSVAAAGNGTSGSVPSPSSLPVGSVIPMPHFHSLCQCALDSSAVTLTAAIDRITAMHRRHHNNQFEKSNRTMHMKSSDLMIDVVDEHGDSDSDEFAPRDDIVPTDNNSLDIVERSAASVDEDAADLIPAIVAASIARPFYSHMAGDSLRMLNV